MEKADQVRLNHELLIWRGFTLSNGVWSYPDGVTVDNGVPYFPESLDATLRWLAPKLRPKTLMMETFKNGYDWCILSEKPSGGVWNGNDEDPALALCLAIQKLIRSK